MKYILLFTALFTLQTSARCQSLWEQAQQIVKPENYSDALEAKHGFQDIRLGSNIESFIKKQKVKPFKTPGKIALDTAYLIKNSKDFNIGDISIKLMIIRTFKDSIYSIEMSIDRSRLDDLLKPLTESYGSPETNNDVTQFYWESETVSMKIFLLNSLGVFNLIYTDKILKKELDEYNKSLSKERAEKL
jgi:hypothetical protein